MMKLVDYLHANYIFASVEFFYSFFFSSFSAVCSYQKTVFVPPSLFLFFLLFNFFLEIELIKYLHLFHFIFFHTVVQTHWFVMSFFLLSLSL